MGIVSYYKTVAEKNSSCEEKERFLDYVEPGPRVDNTKNKRWVDEGIWIQQKAGRINDAYQLKQIIYMLYEIHKNVCPYVHV